MVRSQSYRISMPWETTDGESPQNDRTFPIICIVVRRFFFIGDTFPDYVQI